MHTFGAGAFALNLVRILPTGSLVQCSVYWSVSLWWVAIQRATSDEVPVPGDADYQTPKL